ncbi:unnamed protein product [marine sediment metagenome]|uniref:Tetratricopeptide repeat protein n=1 Tax=marine sediment metagenome TaxID=412755 RepID=X1IKG2_9ZZZZ
MISYLAIAIGVLTFCFGILGLWDFPKISMKGKRKKIIMCILIALILLLTIWIVIINKSKEEEGIRYKKYSNYEKQKNRLMIEGLSPSDIENLGDENPLLRRYYLIGQENERTGSFEEAIKNYEEILKYRLSSYKDQALAYNLIGNCYLEIYEICEFRSIRTAIPKASGH